MTPSQQSPSTGLTPDALAALPAAVAVPRYDRTALVPAVVHIGVGGFHRAHQAVYLDELACRGETGWGIVGVGLRRTEMGEVLQAQDGLFTVVERGPDGDAVRVVGSLVRYLYAPEDPDAVLSALADPRTRLVTLTITGGGYGVDADGQLDRSDAGVRHDLQHPEQPQTAMGYLVEGLRRRRDAGTGPFTVLSCDNLPDSGAAARTAVLGFAELRDPDLARWIAEQVTFPSSMVDRITPETSPATRDEIEATHGVPDRWPVVCEPFTQWVVEDDFCAGRPPLERVGVQLVADVTPYKNVKARLLNGGHSVLGYVGSLCGHSTTAEAMADPVVRAVVERVLREEVRPLLPEAPGMHLEDYVETTLGRFANPAMADGLDRLCRRGSVKVPSYLLPSLRQAREEGRPSATLVLALAAWLRYLRGTDLAGRPIDVQDPKLEALQALVRRGGDDPRPVLGMRSIFGTLADDRAFVEELSAALRRLSREGVESALRACQDEHVTAA